MMARPRHFGGAGIGGLVAGLTPRRPSPDRRPSAFHGCCGCRHAAVGSRELPFPGAIGRRPPRAGASEGGLASADSGMLLSGPSAPTYPVRPLRSSDRGPPPAGGEPLPMPKPAPQRCGPGGQAGSAASPSPRAHRRQSNAVLNDSQTRQHQEAAQPDARSGALLAGGRGRAAQDGVSQEADNKSTQGEPHGAIDMSKMDVQGLKSAGYPLVMSFSDDQRRELKSLAHLLGLESAMAGL